MRKNLFYSGLHIESKDVVDKRLYINGLTTDSLKDTFGQGGRFAGKNVFTFNTKDDKFYKLVTHTDPLNPSSWKKLVDSFVIFPEFVDGESYVKGSSVMFDDSFNRVGFYIAVTQTQEGQSPETHPNLWFKISAPSEDGNLGGYRNTILHSLNPNSAPTQEITITFDKNSLPENTSPSVECYVDLDDPQEGYTGWVRCVPSVVTWTTGSMIKTKIAFSGDMDSIRFNSGEENNNVKIVIV